MSTETRLEVLSKLRSAKNELDAIERLQSEKNKLEAYKKDTSISAHAYKTNSAAELVADRQKNIDRAWSEIKANTWISWLLMIVGVAIAFGANKLGYGGVFAPIILGSIAVFFISRFILKKRESSRHSHIFDEIYQKYEKKIADAERNDQLAEAAYHKAVAADQAKRAAEVQPKLDNIEHQIRLHRQNFINMNLLSFEDVDQKPELISQMLRLIESGRADNVKECFRLIDEEEYRKKEEARRRAEEEQRREEERKRNSPGRIYVYVGEPRSGGEWKVPRNEITIDGQSYGPGTIPYKEIVLQPGWHTICVAIQYTSEYIYRSDTIQFNLDGCGEKYYQFFIKSPHRGVEIKECASRSDLSRHP